MIGAVLLGPPGVGKGTQAKRLSERLGIPWISTGSIFRANIREETELGLLAASYIDRGKYVPDEITIPMVQVRFTADDVREGFLLDGFPRTLAQAHALRDILAAQGLELTMVLEITAPNDVLVKHMIKRAAEEGRSDDNPAVFAQRLKEYHHLTEPIATYYADQDLLVSISGIGSIEEVSDRILNLPQLAVS